ncbi:MAG: hypothetical protein P4N59_10625 [Negativicutes bacterium]|nr:hypothetical protein [Negativicutes bacterium]
MNVTMDRKIVLAVMSALGKALFPEDFRQRMDVYYHNHFVDRLERKGLDVFDVIKDHQDQYGRLVDDLIPLIFDPTKFQNRLSAESFSLQYAFMELFNYVVGVLDIEDDPTSYIAPTELNELFSCLIKGYATGDFLWTGVLDQSK